MADLTEQVRQEIAGSVPRGRLSEQEIDGITQRIVAAAERHYMAVDLSLVRAEMDKRCGDEVREARAERNEALDRATRQRERMREAVRIRDEVCAELVSVKRDLEQACSERDHYMAEADAFRAEPGATVEPLEVSRG